MRTRELTLAFAASLGCAAVAQYEPDTLKALPPVCDVFVLPGGQLENMYAIGLDQWRELAPTSDLLSQDLSGYRGDFRGKGDRARSMGLAMSIGLRLGGPSRTNRSGSYLRAGFTYQSHEGNDLDLRMDTRTPYDTLTSAQTGQVTYVDSLTIRRYQMSHRYEQVALDGSLIFLKEYPKRWSLYGGVGLQLGLSMAGRVQVDHTVERLIDPSLVSGQSGNPNRDQERETEEFATKSDLCMALYAPLGVSYRLGRKSLFWRAMNLTCELRPTLAFGGVPELSAGARAGLGSYFGLRVDLAK
ncbi:MAG: hypothetical protein KA791_07565 [Flavobacteriales bacterium]|nr:hypothetical protein [Flavobacteriales bacterium]